MTDAPLVTIVIPTYDQEESFLRESIESAIGQTYKNVEILISDNHSTNGASEIINLYAQNDNRIRIIKPPQFLSLKDNFIFAYDNIKGEFVCPLSSDDILYPAIIEEQLQPFATYPDLSFSYSVPLYFDNNIHTAKWVPGKLKTGFYPSDIFLNLFLQRRNCSWGGILFKTASYQKIGGFSTELNFSGDADAIIKLIKLGGGVYCINKPLSAIRQWGREEHTSRIAFVLNDMSKIYDNMLIKTAKTNNSAIKIVEKAKKKLFLKEALPIAYFIQLKKRNPLIVEQTIVVIKEKYPKGVFKFIIDNRKNVIGLIMSLAYLGYMKLKKI